MGQKLCGISIPHSGTRRVGKLYCKEEKVAEEKRDNNFTDIIGMELIGFQDNGYTASLEVNHSHHNMMGFVHGGVLATLLDTVLARSFFFSLPEKERNGVTLEMKVNFLKAVKGGRLIVEGQVINKTRQTAYVEGWIKNDTGRFIAKASATIICIPNKKIDSDS